MSAKWTPGPWTIEAHEGAGGVENSITYSIDAGPLVPWENFPSWPHHPQFCVVEVSSDRDYNYPEGGIKSLHDARLIAAAPDLYESLEEMRIACAACLRVISTVDGLADVLDLELRRAGVKEGFGTRSAAALTKARGATRPEPESRPDFPLNEGVGRNAALDLDEGPKQ